ncbi:hypothetical protein JCM8097_004792 [Rhodosporidiobolus ruineniae]
MATDTTPNGTRRTLQPINTRSHSTRTAQRDTDARPAAPFFAPERQFLAALGQGNALAGPSTAASHPMQTTRVDGSKAAQTLAPSHLPANSRKRTQDHLVQDDNTSPDTAQQRQLKKQRAGAATTAGQPVDANVKRVKGSTRRTVGDRAEKEKMAHESAQWRAKYKKAFPSFTFYFDAIDEGTKSILSLQVRKLGANVDNFFSKKVTHVVTTRQVPTGVNKENVDSPNGAAGKNGAVDSAAGKAKKQRVPSPKMYSLVSGQKLRTMTGDAEKNPFIDSQDILSKALDFGLKIWPCDKLQLILTRINAHSPNKVEQNVQRNPSLPSLLRDEQLYGTAERDPFVPRSNMHYFSSSKHYLLVEDSTGEHRPIVIKEYERPRKHEDPEWPVLWGGVEGRTGFYHYDGEITYEQRKRPPPPPPVQQQDAPAKSAARPLPPNLRRAVSLQNVARGADATVSAQQHHYHPPRGVAGGEYLAASGNSQIITSNIASATSTAGARSGAAQASRFAPGQGPFVDKRLAVLSNRTVSVAGGALLGGASASATASTSTAATTTAGAGRVAALKRSAAPPVPGKLQRSVSVDAGLSGRRVNPALVQVRDEPKKPGYCENCRLKYDDFKDHVVSSKHRRFALNPKNWLELDQLLGQINRPLAPQTLADIAALNSAFSAHGSSEGESVDAAGVADDSGFFDAVGVVPAKDGENSEESDEEGSERSSEEEEEEEEEEDEEMLDDEEEEEEETEQDAMNSRIIEALAAQQELSNQTALLACQAAGIAMMAAAARS